MSNFKLNTVDCIFTPSESENNLILVESINETFFDVFECTIDGKTFIFEKLGEENGLPLVLCDIIKDGKHYVTEALLKTDKEGGIFINESLMHGVIEQQKILKPANEPNLIEESKLKELSKTKDNTDTSAEVNTLIAETITRYNEKKVQEKMNDYTNIYQSRLDEFENKKKEFLSVIDKEFEDRVKTFNKEIDTKLYDFFKLNEQDNKFLVFNETEKLRESVSDISEKFKLELKNVKEFSKENINRIFDNKSKEIYEKIYQHTDKIIEQNKQTISENINKLSNTFTKELNELKLLKSKIPAIDKGAIERQNKKFKSILEHVNSKFNQLNKKVKLISESKNDEYNELLAAVNNKEVVEYKTILKEKIETAELNSVKSELLNELNGNIQNEVRGMKRYAEMSAGGGTNAVQYANGGTMNGNLNVNGELKADTILATTLLSATTMDINFELSGFSVTGDVSASGGLSASKITSTGGIGFQTTKTGAGVTIKGDDGNGPGFYISKYTDGTDGPRQGQFYHSANNLFINSIAGNDTHGDIQLATGDINNGPVERVTIKGDTGRVGIGDTTPSEMLEVTGNIKASGNLSATNITVTDDLSAGDIIKGKRLNIGTGNLFVDDGSSTGSAFVKIGAYGSGNFFGKEGSVNGAAFSLGVGTAGKIVEDMKIDTFALSGAGLVNKTTNPVILVPSPGANKYIVPVSIQVYKSQIGGLRVAWGVSPAAISIGVFASSDTTGVFSQLTALPRSTALIAGDWLYNRNQGPDTTKRIISNRALAFRTSSNITSNSSADVYYLKIRYMVMSEDGDFKSIGNLQIKDS